MDAKDRMEHINDPLYQCMKGFNHGPNSRMSITINSSKGLTNAPGQNNCFLNSAVQVLWHLGAFRRSFRELSGHSCMGNACIFCALKVLFTQFQYSDKTVLTPDALRGAMAETFANEQRFQLGLMDDAAECFENILTRIHSHIASDEREDSCTAPHCIPHRKFTMSVTEQMKCGCGAKSEPFTYNEMVFYVSTGALVREYKNQTSDGLNNVSFSSLLRNTVSRGDLRSCTENCGKQAEKIRTLKNIPDVVSIGLVWESAKSNSHHIRDVVNCIGTTLNPSEMFHSEPGKALNNRATTPLQLVGVVCYYGKHYSTFFYHSRVCDWIYFDDAAVKQVSPEWSKVCEKLCKGRHQPLLLLYMNPNSQPVDVTRAPKSSTMAPGYEWDPSNTAGPVERGRSKTPVPERPLHCNVNPQRSVTPSPQKPAYPNNGFQLPVNTSRQTSRSSDHSSNINLSRADSGLSSQSSHVDTASGRSEGRTRRVDRQSSDAGSYSSTQSSAAETDDSYQPSRPRRPGGQSDKPRVLTKKNREKNIANLRLHSASSMSLNQPAYDDSSLPRNASNDEIKNYATLPRKVRLSPAGSPTKPSEPSDTTWIHDIVSKNEKMRRQNSEPNPPSRSTGQTVRDKPPIAPPHCPPSSSIKPHGHSAISVPGRGPPTGSVPANRDTAAPESMKPLLPMKTRQGRADGPGYISRSSVEKILSQQKKVVQPSGMQPIRPTHDKFVLADEYLIECNKPGPLKFDAPDNASLGSLKDSGYKSSGGPGSTSASSISSMSAESPTQNQSFNFEPLYSEPPPLDNGDDDFPPPPTEYELMTGGHAKQLSEASLLSEASTVRQRSEENLHAPSERVRPVGYSESGPRETGRLESSSRSHLHKENNNSYNSSDQKLFEMLKQAEDFGRKSLEREEHSDLSTALVYSHQAVSLLTSVLAQRPSDLNLERHVQEHHSAGLQRSHHLHTSIMRQRQNHCGPMLVTTAQPVTAQAEIVSDYTPLASAIKRTPCVKLQLSGGSRTSTDHQLSHPTSKASIDRSSVGYGSRQTSKASTESGERESGLTSRQPQSSPAQRLNSSSPAQRPNAPSPIQRANAPSPAPSIIPPPKEFSEDRGASVRPVCPVVRRHPARVEHQSNQYSYPLHQQATERPCDSGQIQRGRRANTSEHSKPNDLPERRQPQIGAPESGRADGQAYDPREMRPSRLSISKQSIRQLLAEDMKKRTGQKSVDETNGHYQPQQGAAKHNEPLTNNYHNPYNQNQTAGYSKPFINYSKAPSTYDQYSETPLWTPPQQSTDYSLGLSHYDKPAHHYQQYGRVNTHHSRPEPNRSDYDRPRYHHAHTYSTEL